MKNIPTDFTEDQLRNIFEEFGEINSAKVKGDGTDIGYVEFKTNE